MFPFPEPDPAPSGKPRHDWRGERARPDEPVRSRTIRLITYAAVLVLAVTGLQAATTSTATGQVAVVEVEERYTLTVKLLDHTGQAPSDDRLGSVTAFNDTWEDWQGQRELTHQNRSGFAGDGEHSFEVYDGVYTLFTRLFDGPQGVGTTDASASRQDWLVAMEVPVHGNTEVTLDAREGALLTQPEVGQEVQVRSNTTAWCHTWANGGVECTPDLDASGNEIVDRGAHELYVTPFPDWTLQPTWLWEQWHMGEPQPLSPVPNMDYSPRNYSPTPAYLYRTALLYDHGASAQDLTDRSFSTADFVEVPTSYHADQPETIIGTHALARPAYPGEPEPLNYGGYPSNKVYFEPGEVTEYYLADDRFVWTKRDWQHFGSEPGPSTSGLLFFGQDVYLESEAGTRREVEQHFQAPHQHGAAEANDRYWEHTRTGNFPSDANAQIVPGMVRIGDQFYPPFSHSWGSIPGRVGVSLAQPFETSWRMWNADTGLELPSTNLIGAPLFRGLTPGLATYQLEQSDAYPEWMEPHFLTKPSGTSSTVWTFKSAPSAALLPPEYRCPNSNEVITTQNDRACQIQPLIQLDYDLGLDAYNRAEAGWHVFSIGARPHSEAVGAAPVTEMSVQASFDDGATWQDVSSLAELPDKQRKAQLTDEPGQFQFQIKHPGTGHTNGYVSLRVQATDANGGTVDQSIIRAYILK